MLKEKIIGGGRLMTQADVRKAFAAYAEGECFEVQLCKVEDIIADEIEKNLMQDKINSVAQLKQHVEYVRALVGMVDCGEFVDPVVAIITKFHSLGFFPIRTKIDYLSADRDVELLAAYDQCIKRIPTWHPCFVLDKREPGRMTSASIAQILSSHGDL